MRRSVAIPGRIAIWVAMAGACAMAGLIAAWPSGEDPADGADAGLPKGKDVPAGIAAWSRDAVAPPVAGDRLPDQGASAEPRPHHAAALADELQRALFSPHPAYPRTRAFTPMPVLAAANPALAAPALVVASKAPAAARRTATVLNDAQIASIKGRLNLTPDQERMWPAVEVALRKLAYAKRDRGARKPGANPAIHDDAQELLASLDPASEDVQHLKSVAAPLIMSFSDDQERELRTLAQIAGLDKLIPGRNADPF
ncbi:MAG TPA: hypothetical protein VK281_17925 [Xanthobacteraceae bacterium]|nr:hypothetical protein [Xanthobacteraceae bacterium]